MYVGKMVSKEDESRQELARRRAKRKEEGDE
jgi:hypothetical protein